MKLNKNTSPATTISSLPAPQPQSVRPLDGIFIRHNDYYSKFLYKDLLSRLDILGNVPTNEHSDNNNE